VTYEVVPGSGPTMAATGLTPDPSTAALVDEALADLVAGRDATAAARSDASGSGTSSSPTVVSPTTSTPPCAARSGSSPVRWPRGGSWRSAVRSRGRAWSPPRTPQTLGATGSLPVDAEVEALRVWPDGRATGRVSGGGVLVLAELPGDRFEATADGVPLPRLEDSPVAAFEVPEGGASLEVEPAGQAGRTLALVGQVLIALLVLSLMLRPPGFARGGDVEPVDRTRVSGGAS
jgi:hypothetical protein